MAVTVREIAEKAGVSPATVSRYLTGVENVRPDKASRVRAVLSGLENDQAPRIRVSPNPLIGVLVPDFRLQFYVDALRELSEQIVRQRFQMILIPQTGNEQKDYLDTLRSLNLSGLVLLNEEIPPELMKLIRDKSWRAVVCGGANLSGSRAIHAVHVNDLGGGYEGTRYLIRSGHRNIAFLGDLPRSISSGFQRMVGAKQALGEAGLPFHECLWRYGEMTDDLGYRLTLELLAEKQPFTALFAFSDQMAIGAMRALRDRGIRVPEDISVMGFDDLPIAQTSRPRLTTIYQSLKDIVANTLSIFAQSERGMAGVEINVPFSVVERESCRPIAPRREGTS